MKKFLSVLTLLALVCTMFVCTAFAETSMVTTGNVYMRKGPGTEYAKIRVLSKGTSVTKLSSDVSESGTVWYKVKANGRTGWVISAYLSEETQGTITMYGGDSYIRKKPSVSAKVLGVIYKDDSADYIDTAYDSRNVLWYKIEYDGITGWVSSKYTQEPEESKTYIYAKNGNTYIRKTYDISSKKLAILPQGESAVYLGVSRYDDRSPAVLWYKVEYDGVTGWVSSKYTKKK